MRYSMLSVRFAALAVAVTIGFTKYSEAQTPDLVAQGRQALAAEKFDEALTTLEQAVAADAKNPAALAWFGNAQVRMTATVPLFDRPNWVKQGMDTLDQAVERFPNDWVVYLVRGSTAARLPSMFAKGPQAVKDLNRVIAMHEKNPSSVSDGAMVTAYLNLGFAHKQNGDMSDARAAWEKGKKLYPQAPEAAAMDKEIASTWQ